MIPATIRPAVSWDLNDSKSVGTWFPLLLLVNGSSRHKGVYYKISTLLFFCLSFYLEVCLLLQIREHHYDATTVFTLAGPFCRATTSGVHTRILGATKIGCHHIILDFSGVTEFDATGLAELFLWSLHLNAHQVQISLVKSSAYVGKHLNWELLSSIVPIYASEEDAVEHAGNRS